MSIENLFDRLFPADRAARVAILFEHRQLTYEELRALIVLAAERLHAVRPARGDRVAILLNDSPEFIASFVAIISLGAIAVPINMALRRDDQIFILKDCGARAAIIEAQTIEALFGADSPREIEPADLNNLLVVSRDDSDSFSIAAINSQILETAQRRPLTDSFPVRGESDADAFILYTSGSTGE